MAKSTATKKANDKTTKEPGRWAQLWRYYRMTAKQNPKSVLWSLGSGAVVFGVVFGFGFLVSAGATISIVIWSITAFFTGVLTAMIVMNKQAERSAFGSIEGRAGAVGAILSNGLKRGWRAPETPAAVNASTQEAVYRVVGPGGVVLIGEGTSRSRVASMLETEKKKVAKVATGVPVHTLYVVGDEHSVKLIKLLNTVYAHKRSLNRNEVSTVYKRLDTVGLKLPIPKGIDPNRMRPQRR